MSINTKRSTKTVTYGPIDWWIVATIGILACFGLIMVLSASGITGERIYEDPYLFFKKQTIFTLLGLVAMIICANLPRKFINNIHYPAIFISLFLLLITLSPFGLEVNGSKRWIPFGLLSLQPMEFAKISLVLYLAYFFSEHKELAKDFSKGVIPPFAVTLIFCALLLLQPDFGSSVILLALLFFLCFTGGTRFIYFALSFILMTVGSVFLIGTSSYRVQRVLAFLDPFKDAQDSGYQLVQSFYAFGRGGFFGVGIGNGRQKIEYLPEAHNDFIMSVVGEELGLIGVTLLMILFSLFFARCYRLILGQKNQRDKLTSFGLTLILALSVTLNLAVVMGMVPPKGVAMPFLSYGGSSLLASFICVGLLLNYSRTADPYTKDSMDMKSSKIMGLLRKTKNTRIANKTKNPKNTEVKV